MIDNVLEVVNKLYHPQVATAEGIELARRESGGRSQMTPICRRGSLQLAGHTYIASCKQVVHNTERSSKGRNGMTSFFSMTGTTRSSRFRRPQFFLSESPSNRQHDRTNSAGNAYPRVVSLRCSLTNRPAVVHSIRTRSVHSRSTSEPGGFFRLRSPTARCSRAIL
jgi:hypothetical protein